MTIDEAIEILQEEHDWSQEKSYVIKALEISISALKEISQEQPTVDAVPVVRCKDCAHMAEAKVNRKGFLICPASGMEITDHDFCSYGERRERDIIDEAREMVETLRWIASNEEIVFNARSATEAADLIERLAEAGESGPAGWISVKDRMPEPPGDSNEHA